MGELAQGLLESLAGRYTLERELGRGGMAWLRIDPTFDELRTQPRFQKLVEVTA